MTLVILIIISISLPTEKRRFLRYEKTLPLSKIHSMTTGSVKLQGKLYVNKWVTVPLRKPNCIGYHLTVHQIKRDLDDDKHYRLTHEESDCRPFIFQNPTKKVQVNG